MAVSCDGEGVVTVLEKKAHANGDGIALTEFAAQKVKLFLEKANGKFLRVSVLPGGCAGFSYDFTVEKEAKKDDKAFEFNGVGIIADEFSMAMLTGSRIDWVENLQVAGLSVENPNATKSCGCGHSFG